MFQLCKIICHWWWARIASFLKTWTTALCSKMQEVLLLSWTFSTTFVPDRTGVLSLGRQQQQDFRCCRTVCLLPGLKSVELFGPSSDACSELRGGVFQGLLLRGPGYSKRGLTNLWKVGRELLWCLSLLFDVLVICERSHFTEIFLLG